MLYPLSTPTRTVQNLDGVWHFMLENDAQPHDVKQPLDSDLFMAVPGSFNDQGVIEEIRMHVGYVWYERDFVVPEALKDQRVMLRFDAATHEADVYINGEHLMHHRGGYTPFEGELNELLKPGRNRLTVKLSNMLDYTTLPIGNYSESKDEDGNLVRKLSENFDFFNYAGLNRSVRIYTTPKSYIEDITVTYDVDLDKPAADVRIGVDTVGEAGDVKVTILDADDKVVGEAEGKEAEIKIADLKLWQPLDAYLYTAKVELLQDGKVVDSYEEPFGVRTVEVKDCQFLINGKPFYFKGYGKHEDTPVNGRGINEAYNVADINIMKWMGANSFRTSHYPYSEEMMRLCDREGIVVIDEVAAVGMYEGFSVDSAAGMKAESTWDKMDPMEDHKQALAELVKRDKNHACVVLWSVMNEPDSAGNGALEYFEEIFDFARTLDPQERPLTYVNFQICPVDKDVCMHLCDVVMMNRYFGWYWDLGDLDSAQKHLREDLAAWHEKFPDKPIIYGEFGADTVAGLHAIDPIPFTEDYQTLYYEANCEVFDETPYFVGEHVWNFADFETKIGLNRVQGNRKGVLTRDRRPKAAARWLRDRWLAIPDFYDKQKKD